MESSPLLTAVAPVRPVAGYIGGKRNLAKRLVAIIDRVPHSLYAEPFVGMGGIFLRRTLRPKVEVINDISGDVTTLFRVLREHYPYMIDLLRFRFASRADFNRLMATRPDDLTDLQRAIRFLYLQRLAFGGKVDGRTYGVSATQGARFNQFKLEPMLADVNERLAGVTIEQLPWDRFIPRYDRPGALFYLDPPYFGCEDDYGADVFSRADFAAMADLLGRIAGRFILSINDRPEVRETFAAFAMRAVETTYTISASAAAAGRKVGELIITNLPLAALDAANDV